MTYGTAMDPEAIPVGRGQGYVGNGMAFCIEKKTALTIWVWYAHMACLCRFF